MDPQKPSGRTSIAKILQAVKSALESIQPLLSAIRSIAVRLMHILQATAFLLIGIGLMVLVVKSGPNVWHEWNQRRPLPKDPTPIDYMLEWLRGDGRTRTIIKYDDAVDESNIDEFVSLASAADGVIGFSVQIEPSKDQDGKYNVFLNKENELQITVKDEDGGGSELIVPDAYYRYGSYYIDGFFISKGGGLHQGWASAGLVPTDEALILTNMEIKIRERRIYDRSKDAPKK